MINKSAISTSVVPHDVKDTLAVISGVQLKSAKIVHVNATQTVLAHETAITQWNVWLMMYGEIAEKVRLLQDAMYHGGSARESTLIAELAQILEDSRNG